MLNTLRYRLEDCKYVYGAKTIPRSRTDIPDNVTGLEFLGYNSSGITRDSQGVLRLREISTRDESNFPGSWISNSIMPFRHLRNDFLKGLYEEPKVYEVGRTDLDLEVSSLEEQIREIKFSPFLPNYFSTEDGDHLYDRWAMLQDVQMQVDNSLEDSRIFRENQGRLVRNPIIDGVEFTVDIAQVQEQLGDRHYPLFLKSREYRVNDGKKQVIAKRFFQDLRVVVAYSFKGHHKRPTKTSIEFGFDDKRRLMKLFRQLIPEIHEVKFPDQTRIRTD